MSNVKKRSGDLLASMASAFNFVGAVSVLAITVGIVADVTLRAVRGGSGVAGIVEFTPVLLVLAGYLGLADAELRERHIRSTMVSSRLTGRVGAGVSVVTEVTYLVIATIVTVPTFGRALESFEAREYKLGLVSVPVWPARVAISLGLALLVVVIGRSVLRRLLALGKGQESDVERIVVNAEGEI